MAAEWERKIERWHEAGLVDGDLAARLRLYEAERRAPEMRWSVVLLLAAGAVSLGAGVLLFVASHWDTLAPGQRFACVLVMVAAAHLAGAVVASRLAALAAALHAVGTVALGAGIFLAGQIFNLDEHWATGFLLWALGAWAGWLIRRDWVQAAMGAILTPVWVWAEWSAEAGTRALLQQGALLLAITCLTACRPDERDPLRRTLGWIGGIALLPFAAVVMADDWSDFGHGPPVTFATWGVGVLLGYVIPLVVAGILRGAGVRWNLGAALWVFLLAHLGGAALWQRLALYVWAALGAAELVSWGLAERRRERIDLGMAGFVLVVVAFYCSNVMSRIGRSASLMGLGIVLLVVGSTFARMRRRLVGGLAGSEGP